MPTIEISNQDPSVDPVKFCLYNVNDKIDGIPVEGGVGTVGYKDTQGWTKSAASDLGEWKIIFFTPGFFDTQVASGTVKAGQTATLTAKGGVSTA